MNLFNCRIAQSKDTTSVPVLPRCRLVDYTYDLPVNCKATDLDVLVSKSSVDVARSLNVSVALMLSCFYFQPVDSHSALQSKTSR